MSADGGSASDISPASHRAWAVLPGWSGPPELLARIAQAAMYEVTTLEKQSPECAIKVTVPVVYEGGTGEDVERFASPKDLVEKVTADALRKFASIHMCVTGKSARVEVRIFRERGLRFGRLLKPILGGRGTEGVSLDVTSTDPDAYDVKDVRDNVLAAIGRGYSKWRHAGIATGGHTPFGDEVSQTLGEDPRAGMFTKALIGCAVVIAVAQQLDLFSVGGTYLLLALVVGLLASAAAYMLLPVVEVSASTRIGQAGRAAVRAALLVAGPVVGLVVNHLAG
jgi:hypothetical protein